MIRALALAVLALTATACDTRSRNAQKALDDARDVARVEAAQNVTPPIVMLHPQPIVFKDIEDNKLFGAGCVFIPAETAATEGKRTLFALAMQDAAYLKIGGELRIYAADKGSPALPLASWTRYEGREHIIDIQTSGEMTRSSEEEETTDWPGRMTVRDPYDRVVFSAAGTVQCGV